MSWFTDRVAEAEERQRRSELIVANAVEVYENLWSEFKVVIEEAKASGYKVTTNGSPQNREVRLSLDPIPGKQFNPDKTFKLSLASDKRTITASGRSVNVKLDFEVGEDDVVGLVIDGEGVSIHKAAARILDPFFFPQLQSPKAK